MSNSSSFVLLEAAPGPENPLGMLMACHRRLEAKLDTLARVVEVYQQVDEERYDQAAGAIGLVIRHLHGPARLHHEDEEISLFPRLIAQDAAMEQRLGKLELEHEKLEARWAALLPTLTSLAEGTEPKPELVAELAQGVEALSEAYRGHIRAEDEEIYVDAARLLDAGEIAAIGAEMKARRHIV
jgi:hemerythrin-like domain-containing protein